MALMAARSSASGLSSMGVGPLVVLVRSRRRFGSRHSSSCMPRSVPVSLDALEYVLHRVLKYCHPSDVSPAAISGRSTGFGFTELAWLWSTLTWASRSATTTAGSVPSGME